MENAVIHLVTNRSGDFHHPSLASVSRYTPHTEDGVEAAMRDLLHLRDTDTDYYVVGALAALYAFPDIAEEFKESGRTFDLAAWRADDDQLTGGSFQNTSQDAFYLHRVPDEFPVITEWTITHVDASTAKVTGTTTELVGARESGGILYVEWPDHMGLRGAVNLDGAWAAGAFLNLRHTPVGFPYARAVEKLEKYPDIIKMITDRGYMGPYWSAQSDMEKYALALTAMAWPTTRHG